MKKPKKFYVIWKGRTTGVFADWDECSAQIAGFANAEYKGFDSLAAAQTAFRGKYEDYKGKFVSSLSQQRLLEIGQPIFPSYSVDAACAGNPGSMEYQCVHTETGQEIFRQGPFEYGTSNVGEFLAIVHALALFKKKSITAPIYSDSENAIAWTRDRRCKTNLPRNDQSAKVFALIDRAERWLASNEFTNKILKWETEAWGEIPADFGRK
jgi:ribonuclease HI